MALIKRVANKEFFVLQSQLCVHLGKRSLSMQTLFLFALVLVHGTLTPQLQKVGFLPGQVGPANWLLIARFRASTSNLIFILCDTCDAY